MEVLEQDDVTCRSRGGKVFELRLGGGELHGLADRFVVRVGGAEPVLRCGSQTGEDEVGAVFGQFVLLGLSFHDTSSSLHSLSLNNSIV